MKFNKYKSFILDYEPFDISEGLIKSVDPSMFVYQISKLLTAKDIEYNINYLFNGNIFIDLINMNKNDLNFYFRLIGNLGYFISEYKFNNINKKYIKDDIDFLFYNKEKIDISIYVEPYYDVEIKNLEILYHTTPNIFVDKILKYGLIPKSKNKISFHPDRIFLCTDLNKIISIANKFKSMSNYKSEWKILEINSKNIKELKCYEDPNYRNDGGIYTLNNIKPEYIKLLNIVI